MEEVFRFFGYPTFSVIYYYSVLTILELTIVLFEVNPHQSSQKFLNQRHQHILHTKHEYEMARVLSAFMIIP